MKRAFLVIGLLVACACGGRTLAPPTADDDDDDGGSGAAGAGAGAQGGATSISSSTIGAGGMSGSGGGEAGGAPPNPIECITCVAQNCPEAVSCLTDPDCVQGLVCSVSQCLNNGQPDLMCVADCFNGDFAKALEALQALGCIFMDCGDACSGLLPI
ncbi:MAG TPA: hypothetical protein VFB62_01185 [Polyangiaceae bacterium]|jgi:hypothetical protein|nr:hypothetical protein [Polyangiaceae bacterium]